MQRFYIFHHKKSKNIGFGVTTSIMTGNYLGRNKASMAQKV